MKKIKNILKVLILTIILAGAGVRPAGAADANNFRFSDFVADYYLEETADGNRLRVIEQLTAEFPNYNQNHGITRVIPFTGNGGKTLLADSVGALNLRVTRNGATETISKIETNGDNFVVYIGDASSYVHGTQVYNIEYEFQNVITEFAANGQNVTGSKNADVAYQEIYLDTNGVGWGQGFDKLTANFHLSDSQLAALHGDTSCYVGKQGVSGQMRCTTATNADGFTFSTSNLAPGENLTLAIAFEPGTFIVPGIRYNYTVLVIFIATAVASVLLLIWLHSKWQKVVAEKANYYHGLATPPQYLPPKGCTAAMAKQIYMDGGTASNSYSATLLELAVTHKIKLCQQEGKHKKPEYSISVENLDGLASYQVDVLRILNGGSTPVAGSTIEIKRQAASQTLANLSTSYTSGVKQALKDAKFTEEKTYSPGGAIVTVLMTFAAIAYIVMLANFMRMTQMFGGIYLALATIAIMVAVGIVGLVVEVRGGRYTSRTVAGLDLANYLKGLRDYIALAESDRLKFNQSVQGVDVSPQGLVKLYEKLLPYACIFNLERSWMDTMDKYYRQADISPDWYYGYDYFTWSALYSMMNTTTSHISSSVSYSSGDSGSGGGGFSGGGIGGGGGGGW